MVDDTHQIVISADGHCGASIDAYKPYLDARWHEDFDAWAAAFHDGWTDIGEPDSDRNVGVASYGASVNWDSPARLAAVEGEGIVAEVLFPNTAPPFFPAGAVSASAPGYPPANRREYEQRRAGVRAHNRWLADFCNDVPGRRAGIGQIFLSDIDDSVADVALAAELGLGGVLLPGDHHDQLQHLYHRRLDPVWAACCETGLPVGRHGVFVTEPNDPSNSMSAGLIGLVESRFFTQRALGALILSGVFERFPSLTFAITEVGASWVPAYLAQLDETVRYAGRTGTIPNLFGAEVAAGLSMLPSEYFQTNCFVGTFLDRHDMDALAAIGNQRVMWGSDYPHHEGTSPWTLQALRANLGGLDDLTVDRLTALNAARCYRFDLDLLATHARRVGPSRDVVRRPLTPAEWPAFPEQSVCGTFREGPAT